MVRRRNESTPADLTAAALALFVEKGFAATRLDDVASRAGVSKGTVYLYFKSKDELFRAVIREGMVPAIEHGEAMAAGHQGSSAELLRMLLRRWWELIGGTELAGVPKLMISEARNFPELARFYEAQVIDRCRRLLAGVLNRGIADGEFRAINVDAAVDVVIAPLLMRAVWRYSFGACCQSAETPAPDGEEARRFLDFQTDLLLQGLLKESK